MNIQQFQYVLAVVELRNFEAAAEKCCVTQSTLSTMIGRLEDEFGIKIFNRKTKPVSVTEEGEQIIDRLRIVLNEIDSLNNVIQELKGEMVGDLKMGIIPTIAPYLLPLFLTEFAARFPKVKIIVKEMTTAQIQEGLKLRTLDIGLLAIPLEDPELIEYDLYSEPFLVYDCTEGANPSRVSVNSLDYSKLCLLQEGHCLRTQVQHICDLSTKTPVSGVNFTFESGSIESLIRVTKARGGITILPYLATLELNEADAARLVNFKIPVPIRKIGLITHRYFVKKRLLLSLQALIKEAVAPHLSSLKGFQVIKPLQ